MRNNFLDFCNELRGFDYYCKKSNNQVFKYEMFASKLTVHQVLKRYNIVTRKYYAI